MVRVHVNNQSTLDFHLYALDVKLLTDEGNRTARLGSRSVKPRLGHLEPLTPERTTLASRRALERRLIGGNGFGP